MINQSVMFKILPLSSRWQYGLPLTPVTWRPAHLHFTFYDWKCLMKNRKCSRASAHQALFLMNHCYGGAVSLWNEPVRYFHSVSRRAIDSCLFPQIECGHWRNIRVSPVWTENKSGIASQTKVMEAAFVSHAYLGWVLCKAMRVWTPFMK